MFTGIIEAIGRISEIVDGQNSREFWINATLGNELELGQSVAVDGTCLTVTDHNASGFRVTAIDTTLSRTVAKSYAVGTDVNLERATRVGDRLDGHMVQGHVDGLGTVTGLRHVGETWFLDVRLPKVVEPVTILHGSVTLNGVSLTVNALRDDGTCQVALIPYTWEHTNLSGLEPGRLVNVEGDVIGKYVERLTGYRGRETSDEGTNAV